MCYNYSKKGMFNINFNYIDYPKCLNLGCGYDIRKNYYKFPATIKFVPSVPTTLLVTHVPASVVLCVTIGFI